MISRCGVVKSIKNESRGEIRRKRRIYAPYFVVAVLSCLRIRMSGSVSIVRVWRHVINECLGWFLKKI